MDATFVPTFPLAQPEGNESASTNELVHAARALAALDKYPVDIIHDHTRAGVLTARGRRAPTVATVHGPVAGPESQPDLWHELGGFAPLVAISEAQRSSAPDLNWLGTRHHGIPTARYPMRFDKENFVLFLGRLSPWKGVVTAIEAARTAGRLLIIAGAPTVPSEHAYFEQVVRPQLGPTVQWVGGVDPVRKVELLGAASCLLFPIEWQEPFGLVMVEAMACGTPVVALRAGSVPELVVDGVTGAVCDRPEELPDGIARAEHFQPQECRAHVESQFSLERMVQGYEILYRRVIA
jgi:glycosyltransferase involved in cell wall biosynthesis